MKDASSFGCSAGDHKFFSMHGDLWRGQQIADYVIPKVRYSEGSLFRIYNKVRYSEGSLFRIYHKVRLSEGSLFRINHKVRYS